MIICDRGRASKATGIHVLVNSRSKWYYLVKVSPYLSPVILNPGKRWDFFFYNVSISRVGIFYVEPLYLLTNIVITINMTTCKDLRVVNKSTEQGIRKPRPWSNKPSKNIASNKKLTPKCVLSLLSKYHLQTFHAVRIIHLVPWMLYSISSPISTCLQSTLNCTYPAFTTILRGIGDKTSKGYELENKYLCVHININKWLHI